MNSSRPLLPVFTLELEHTTVDKKSDLILIEKRDINWIRWVYLRLGDIISQIMK